MREWVVVKLFVHDDPHVDAVLAHHRQEHLVPFGEPAFAYRDLLGPGGENGLRERRLSDDDREGRGETNESRAHAGVCASEVTRAMHDARSRVRPDHTVPRTGAPSARENLSGNQ